MNDVRARVLNWIAKNMDKKTFEVHGDNLGPQLEAEVHIGGGITSLLKRMENEKLIKRKTEARRTKMLGLGTAGRKLYAEQGGFAPTTTPTPTRTTKTTTNGDARSASNVVKRYLDAMKNRNGARGDAEAQVRRAQGKLATVRGKLAAEPASFARLRLLQQERDLLREVDSLGSVPQLEAEFIQLAPVVASEYGIEYATWREAGVDAAVLEKAGIK